MACRTSLLVGNLVFEVISHNLYLHMSGVIFRSALESFNAYSMFFYINHMLGFEALRFCLVIL